MTQPRRRLTTLPLVAATYFMVAGGPYGLEELLAKAGVWRAALVIVVTPFVWSLPTSLMVAELGAAIPEEGGYYAWVKRALGPFWGFQEAWLSLAASVFDMAIYPTLFVTYLARLWPAVGAHPTLVGGAMIAACVGANLGGAKAAGRASEALSVVLLAPFVLFVIYAFYKHSGAAVAVAPPKDGDLLGALLVAMWNTMGWDNASTVADEVVRPQRTYPIAMLASVALVALTYAVPVVAVGVAGIDVRAWDTGAWVEAGGAVGGPWLATLVVVGGVACGVGMFNALLLSYSRIPAALADDGFLPKVFARRTRRTDAPWVSLVACSVAWAAMLGLSFDRLVTLDILLYGSALLLEFVALVVLRVREPDLARPFKAPGGLPGAIALGVGPAVLLALSLVAGEREDVGGVSALAIGAAVALGGVPLYFALRPRRDRAPASP